MVSLLLGVVAVILGFIGLGIWWSKFISALQAAIPILLVLGGLIAVYGGYTSIKDKEEAKKEEKKEKKK